MLFLILLIIIDIYLFLNGNYLLNKHELYLKNKNFEKECLLKKRDIEINNVFNKFNDKDIILNEIISIDKKYSQK